jgi:hypothetical protein
MEAYRALGTFDPSGFQEAARCLGRPLPSPDVLLASCFSHLAFEQRFDSMAAPTMTERLTVPWEWSA